MRRAAHLLVVWFEEEEEETDTWIDSICSRQSKSTHSIKDSLQSELPIDYVVLRFHSIGTHVIEKIDACDQKKESINQNFNRRRVP
jgi:hypothetical protein